MMKKSGTIVLLITGGFFLITFCLQDKTYIYDTLDECKKDWKENECKKVTPDLTNTYVGNYYHTEKHSSCDSSKKGKNSKNIVRGGIGSTDTSVHS